MKFFIDWVNFFFFYYKLISIFKYSKTSTNSAICLDGTVRPPREIKSKYPLFVALSLSLPTKIREHISHWKYLINLFVIYPEIVYATSLLSGDKKSLFIFDSCWAKMLNISSFFWTGLRFYSQKLMFYFKRDQQVNILSELNTSRRLTKNLPPLICRYWENLFSRGSLWNLWVKMNSYPSSKSSCISIACPLKVRTKALEVCFVRQKSEICSQDSIQSDNLL